MLASAAPRPPATSVQIGFGHVRHTRLRPARNAFTYRTYFLMLPLRTLRTQACAALARNRFAPISFYDADHGDGRSDALQWVDELLQREGITDAIGELWLHCYPRVWGYAFKPVSFWYCHRADGTLRAVVVEVNNTFGEKHVYVLDAPRYGVEMQATKVFHVSPFCGVEGNYRFNFMRSANGCRTVARVDYDDAQGPLLNTSVSGTLMPLNPQSKRYALLHYGAMTLAVIARIHWQAAKLWLRRVPYFKKPPPPSHLVTR
jgi:uncharacterized protein